MAFLSDLKLHRALARFTTVLILSLVYGCAYLPVSQDSGDQGNDSVLPEDLSGFLNAHREEATGEFAASPWGGGVTIKAEPAYFAAIGEYCRKIFVNGSQGEQTLLACEKSGGQWYTRRLVGPMHYYR